MHPLHTFKYCPRCGSPLFIENNEKSKHCESCGFTYYFNPSAATALFIRNNKHELLVCKRAKEPAKGTYDLPGGFCDLDETLEEGAAREALEETGLVVADIKYLFSIPNIYPYSGFEVHTVDTFFECYTTSNLPLQANDDVAETYWIDLKKINPEDFGLTSIRKAIERYKREHSI